MFQLEVASGITFVEGERRGRFPFGNVLVLSSSRRGGVGGRVASPGGAGASIDIGAGEARVLVDTGAGEEVLTAILAAGSVDLVINTHYHIDHVRGNRWFGGAGGAGGADGTGGAGGTRAVFWCPEGEAGPISTWEGFLEFTGFGLPGFDEARLFRKALGWTPTPIARELRDGEVLDLGGRGGLEVVVLRLPGHTPGHTGLWFPSERVIFSADIDLSGFGPWYGDVYGSIDDFLTSIRRLDDLVDEASARGRHPVTIISSHRRPMEYGDFKGRLPRFVARVAARDERILGILAAGGPLTLERVADEWPIYGPQASLLPGVRKSEYFMVKHHLERLARAGRVVVETDDAGPDGLGVSAGDKFGGKRLWRVP